MTNYWDIALSSDGELRDALHDAEKRADWRTEETVRSEMAYRKRRAEREDEEQDPWRADHPNRNDGRNRR